MRSKGPFLEGSTVEPWQSWRRKDGVSGVEKGSEEMEMRGVIDKMQQELLMP